MGLSAAFNSVASTDRLRDRSIRGPEIRANYFLENVARSLRSIVFIRIVRPSAYSKTQNRSPPTFPQLCVFLETEQRCFAKIGPNIIMGLSVCMWATLPRNYQPDQTGRSVGPRRLEEVSHCCTAESMCATQSVCKVSHADPVLAIRVRDRRPD